MKQKKVWGLILVASLGYFVDIYDLIIFNVVKKKSLADLGFVGEAFKQQEITLFNLQMIGMLLGGLLWGVMGDKRGRISVLFGSIILYSLANLANAFVTSIEMYGLCRFIAGLGLAGELGAGITLVSETMPKEKRGYGTMIIVTVGALGAVAASVIGKTDWKTAYIIGGVMGLALLLLRAGTFESGMFQSAKKAEVKKGDFFQLFSTRKIFFKYLNCILIGLPVWFVIGILIALAERFANVIQITNGTVKVGECVMFAYLGLSFGDLISGLLSQYLKSRKKVVIIYLTSCLILVLVYVFSNNISLEMFHLLCFSLGAATGYWALFVTIASEQFGTNLRSTVTNTVPNFVRGAVVPITLSFSFLEKSFHTPVTAALIVGVVCILLALSAVLSVEETFSKDLDYFE